MTRPSDVTLGLEVGPWSVKGRAFDLEGAELGAAGHPFRCARSPSGPIELDPLQVWQTVVEVVHGLARAVPDLGRRTVALGLTGTPGGLCLIDEDGEPVLPLIAATGADRPEAGSAAGRATATLLARLTADQARQLERAACALDLPGWILACLTGHPLQVPPGDLDPRPAPAAAFGDRDWLTPPPADPWQPLPLRPAAAAAIGLWDETPVVVAPPAPIAAGVAAGLADPAFDGGVVVLEADTWVIRPAGQPDGCRAPCSPGVRAMHAHEGEVGGAALDWLVEVAQSLLAEAGLIGLGQAELSDLLERRAQDRRPAAVRFRRSRPPAPGPWTVEGLGASSTLGDVAQAIHEAIGRACRGAFEAGGGVPAEVRATGPLAGAAAAHGILPALLGVPTRLLQRTAPAATGAALCALRTTGVIADLPRAGAAWVQPFLGPPLDPGPPGSSA